MCRAKTDPPQTSGSPLLSGRFLGHARVSTDGQSLAAQLDQLMREVEHGDVLVTRLDRLARSTRDLLNVLAAVAEKGAASRSLGDSVPTPPRRMGG